MNNRIEDRSITVGTITLVQRVGIERRFVTLDTGERGNFLVPAEPLEYALPGGGAIKAKDKLDEAPTMLKAAAEAKTLSQAAALGKGPRITHKEDGTSWSKADSNHTAVCVAKINEMHLRRKLPDLSILKQDAAIAIEGIYNRMYANG